MSFSLLGEHAPGAAVALGEGSTGDGERSAADLARDARAIGSALPEGSPGSEVLIACADRYAFAACLLAAWSRGHSVALPPNGQEQAVRELSSLPQVRAFLHDNDAAHGTSVRPLLSMEAAPPVKAELGHIAGPRHVVTLFTSGTTGAPRACVKTANQLLGEAQMLGDGLCAGLRRVVATVSPIHIYGLLFGIAVPLLRGGAFVRQTPFHARTIAATLRRFEADGLVSVPAHLGALELLDCGEIESGLRVFSSGAALSEETSEMLGARFGLHVTEVLGSSETGGIAWRDRATDPWRPLPGVRVSAASDGQMLLESPFAPPNTQRPLPCPDRIRMAEGGCFSHLGRLDNVVKVASKRVDLDEIQRTLLALPGVIDAAVVAEATSDARGARIAAVVVAPTRSPGSLREALRAHFDSIVLPRQIVCVASLPREANGKLPRERLLAMLRAIDQEGCFGQQVEKQDEAATLRHFDPRPRPGQPGAFDVYVSPSLAYFQGHFEREAILAGVVQLEVLVSRQAKAMWPELVRVRRVTRLRFRRPIRPGDDLVLKLERPEPARVDFKIHCGSQACSSGTLHFEM